MSNVARLPLAVLLVLSGPALAIAAGQPAVALAAGQADTETGAAEQALLDRYCVTCHNDNLRTAGLALDTVDAARVGDHAEIWEKVVGKLRAGMMPPAGRPRPDRETYARLTTYLETELDRAAAANPDPGRTDALRRLNATEYRNAIRDLLDLEVDVAALLPADDSSAGFDNVSLGGLDPGRLERYLTAARRISRLAVGAPVRSAVADTFIVPSDLNQTGHVEGLPFGTRGGTTVSYTFPGRRPLRAARRAGQELEQQPGGRPAAAPRRRDHARRRAGSRVLTVTPPARGAAGGQALRVPDGRPAGGCRSRGPHPGDGRARTSSAPPSSTATPGWWSGTGRPFLKVHITVGGDQRTQPNVYSLTITGPFDATGPRRHAEPAARLHLPARGRNAGRRRGCLRRRDPLDPCAPRVSPARDGCRRRRAPPLLRGGTLRSRFRGGHRDGAAAPAESALEFLLRVERDPEGVETGPPVPGERPGARLAPVFLPLEQPA